MINNQSTKNQVEEWLFRDGIHADKISRSRQGVFTFKKSFFYTHGLSSFDISKSIKKSIPNAEILSYSDEWKRWPKTSYFVIKFIIK